jgi:hypothetical protein
LPLERRRGASGNFLARQRELDTVARAQQRVQAAPLELDDDW